MSSGDQRVLGVKEDAVGGGGEVAGLVGVGGAAAPAPLAIGAGDRRGAERALAGRVAGDAGQAAAGGVLEEDLGVGLAGGGVVLS